AVMAGAFLSSRFGLKLRPRHEICRAPEIGHQLTYGGARRGARKKDWVIERSGGDAASRFGINSGEAHIRGRQEGGARLAQILLRLERAQLPDGDLGIVA